jgi:hypothetical protein
MLVWPVLYKFELSFSRMMVQKLNLLFMFKVVMNIFCVLR